MTARHRAFGLDIESAFPLVELPERPAAGAADVVLQLGSGADIDALWSGPADPPRTREAFVDATPSIAEHGAGGDLLITWGEARFHLSPDHSTLHCAPDAEAPRWRRFLLDTVLATVSMRHGFELVHAGAVVTERGLVAVIGGTGGGKSTLVAELCRRGGSLFCDDLLAVGPGEGAPHCETGPPLMNLALDGPVDPGALGAELARLGDEAWISVERAWTEPAPLAAFVLLDRSPAAVTAELLPLDMPHLVLMAAALDTGSEPDRMKLRFRLMSDLAESTRGLLLRAPPQAAPGALAELAEAAAGATHAGAGT